MFTKHAVLAVGHVDGQAARLDADEVLVERVGLEGVEGPPDRGVLQAVAAALAVDACAGVIGVKPSISGLVPLAEVEGLQAVEDDLRRRASSRSRRRLSMNSGAGGLVADAEDQPGDVAQDQHPPGPRLLADVQLLDRDDQRARARRRRRSCSSPASSSRVVAVSRISTYSSSGSLRVGVQVGLEVVVARPVLRAVHRRRRTCRCAGPSCRRWRARRRRALPPLERVLVSSNEVISLTGGPADDGLLALQRACRRRSTSSTPACSGSRTPGSARRRRPSSPGGAIGASSSAEHRLRRSAARRRRPSPATRRRSRSSPGPSGRTTGPAFFFSLISPT